MAARKLNNFLQKLSVEQIETRRRILEISFKLKLSHLGSCLSAVDLIDAIYKTKERDEKFVLSNGHAGIALYVILEKYGLIKDPKILERLYVHPDRNPDIGISVSSGSLGHGLPIALGMALADRNQNVYCMISDGECTEGSIWESLRLAGELKLDNLKIVLNANGWGAYGTISLRKLLKSIKSFEFDLIVVDGHNIDRITTALKRKTKNKPSLFFAETTVEQLPFLIEQDAHYHIMNQQDYLNALDLLLWS